MGLSTTYTKTETDFLIQQRITTAYLGIATTTTTPPATGAYWYRVNTAGTYMGVTVTAEDLIDNFVYLDVKDGVAEKSLSLKPTNKDYTTDININAQVKVVKTDTGINIQVINADGLIYDSLGGYRFLKVENYNFPNGNNIIYLSGSKTEYTEVNLDVSGSGESVYLFSENFGTKPYYPNRKNAYPIASLSVALGYVPKFPLFEITPKEVDRFVDFEERGLLPKKDFNRSNFYDKLLPFITKYQAKTSDVTLVQTGDSISTNLGWTTPRTDAMFRPPFMTEHNSNSYLEEKLRWKEQKYRRFDAPSVFTEVLGGGTSSEIYEDGIGNAWGVTGSAYSLPLTKVIDGGSGSGVDFKFPAKMRRCNFILHTDYLWANSTKITIAEGNGKVEVKNESGVWVEANNYEFSAKESATLINGAFRKSQEQKRINMRSLSDLTEKSISIKNVGAGRFGYWGIEYSPRQFMFTFVASSIGSQALYGMSFYETWRIDAFNPDLILQQCCIINEGAISGETSTPVITPEDFVIHFKEDYERQIGKGYLVMPYIVWGGAVMGIVNPTTGEWGYSTYGGKNQTIDDYIGQLMNMYNSKDAPALNFFNRFTELAEEKAKEDGTNNIWLSAINGSGGNGDTFTIDTVHLNDYGNEILNRLLLPYFNF